ncbi:CCC motif membrane protein [Aquimarina sp. 2201CG14-23]|uniref:CCC motif membrane protein n=1 Tax=Aquimarina mycalae TaxID=3040073 RepID=UPI0024782270|nr:CCC motif membrane protein [Aquimarina sp. 2201CG14-23]MDH7446849.1 CCC motif membrane protein [Aquimarina sp. 2201CG14-23]
MEKQTLPNSTLILVFGILSIVGCCCYGIGIIFAIVALVLAKKATALYTESPELYSGHQNVKTGKILAIIGLILSVIYFGYIIWLFTTIGYDGILEMQKEMMEQYGG